MLELLQCRLEMIESYKTSPDLVDGFYGEDAAQTVVKLSPSLKRKLTERKERLARSFRNF